MNRGKLILVVEDEEKLATVMGEYLLQAGYSVRSLLDGTMVVEWVRKHAPDLILLDLMLPGKDGFDICKEIRMFSAVPVIMTTARVEEIDRLIGLELGADDYICKPFSPREVVARIKAVLRRSDKEMHVCHQRLELDEAHYLAKLDGQHLELTAVEFKLLQFLAAHPGRIYGRQGLMDHIYPDDRVVADRTIDSHIKKLRRKIAAVCSGEDLIHSVYGAGYKFEVIR
jgi:two-component system, OmpR family, response regulator BaeR